MKGITRRNFVKSLTVAPAVLLRKSEAAEAAFAAGTVCSTASSRNPGLPARSVKAKAGQKRNAKQIKIIGICCSPRKAKTTAASLQVYLDAAKEVPPAFSWNFEFLISNFLVADRCITFWQNNLALSGKVAGVLAVGGSRNGDQDDACLFAFDKSTGTEKWRALNDSASYSATIVIEQADQRVLVCWTGERVLA